MNKRPADNESEFVQMAFTEWFLRLIQVNLGDRSHLAVSDADIFPRVMAVIWTGATHSEVADELCDANAIAERHKEWADLGFLDKFLFAYPSLRTRIAEMQVRHRS